VLDFGIAKAVSQSHTTREGQLKGKLSYMAPEQVRGERVTRQTDVFAASIILWEALTGQRLFHADSEATILANIISKQIRPPSEHAPELPAALDAVVMRGLHRVPAERYATADQMAVELEEAMPPSTARRVGEKVRQLAAEKLAERAVQVADIESKSSALSPSSSDPPLRSVRPPSVKADDVPTRTSSTLSQPPDFRPRSRRLLIGGIGGAIVVALIAIGIGVGRFTNTPEAPPGSASSSLANAPPSAAASTTTSTATSTPTTTSNTTATSATTTTPSATAAASTKRPLVGPGHGVAKPTATPPRGSPTLYTRD
jgi:serine/threonine-protein kinase